MNPDQVLGIFREVVQVCVIIIGPPLVASLVAGVLIGVVQTATQINEASLTYVIKIAAVVLALAVTGPMISAKAVAYTRNTFKSIETVVR